MTMVHWLAFAFITIHSTALAQERQLDALYFTGESTSGASVSGAGGGIEWLHWVSSPTSVVVGGASTSFEDHSWTYGTFGALTRRTHVILMGRASLGLG